MALYKGSRTLYKGYMAMYRTANVSKITGGDPITFGTSVDHERKSAEIVLVWPWTLSLEHSCYTLRYSMNAHT